MFRSITLCTIANSEQNFYTNETAPDISAQDIFAQQNCTGHFGATKFALVKIGAGQNRRRSKSAQVRIGAGQNRRRKKNELTLLYST